MISVVIPLYNKEKSIESTVRSVLEQETEDFELIIVDDASDDDSLRVVKEIQDPRIRIIEQRHAGVSAARNRGISESRYPYISFLDADDLWKPGYLSEIVRLIDVYPKAGVWATAWSKMRDDKMLPQKFNLEKGFEGYVDHYWTLLQPVHLLMSSCITVEKKQFERAGLFDTRIATGQDQDMWVRLMLHTRLAYSNKNLAVYRLSTENRITNKSHKKEERWLYYNEKFNEFRKKNSDFRRYIDLQCIRQAYPNYKRHDEPEYISRLMEFVSLDEQPRRWRYLHEKSDILGYFYRLRSRLILFIEKKYPQLIRILGK